MSETIIDVSNLKKVYKGDKEAVKDISFQVKRGEFFAFLGPNGAGKSTTIKMLTTLMKPSSGYVQIAGYDLIKQAKDIRSKIGVTLQTTAIDPMLTGRELMKLQGRLFRLSPLEADRRAAELLELVNLSQDADRPCGKYSGGMQRRLDLALALIHRPEILFLDEPTVGLDPVSRKEVWDEIKKLNKEFRTTIFLTTQYLDEADHVADKVCIIDNGIIVALEKPSELKRSIALDRICLSFDTIHDIQKTRSILLDTITNIEENDHSIHLFVENSEAFLPLILKKISEVQLYPKHISITSPKLDDVFIQLTKKQIIDNNERVS